MIAFVAFVVLVAVTIWGINTLLDALRDFDE